MPSSTSTSLTGARYPAATVEWSAGLQHLAGAQLDADLHAPVPDAPALWVAPQSVVVRTEHLVGEVPAVAGAEMEGAHQRRARGLVPVDVNREVAKQMLGQAASTQVG